MFIRKKKIIFHLKLKSYIDNVLEPCVNQQQVTREVYTENDVKGKHKHSLNFTIENLFKSSVCHKIFENDNCRKKQVHKKHRDVIVNKSVCIHCGKDCGTNSDSMKRHIEKCQKCKSTKELGEHLSKQSVNRDINR